MIKRFFKRDGKRKWELILSKDKMQKLGVLVPVTSRSVAKGQLDDITKSLFAAIEIICGHDVRYLPESDQSVANIYETLIEEYKCSIDTVFVGNGLDVVDHIIVQFDPKLVPFFPEETYIECKIKSIENRKKVIIFDAKMTDDEATLLIMRDEFDEIRLKKGTWPKFKELFVKS